MKAFNTHLNQNLIVNMIKIRIEETTTQQQHRYKTTKCLWLFEKFQSKGKRFDW